MIREIKIGNKKIGDNHPCFIVAELSGNHHQKFDEAVALIKAAAEAGADAVKLQIYTPDTMTIDSDKEWFVVGGEDNPDVWKGKTLYQLYQEAYTPWEWQPKLKEIAENLGLILFSTPFDETAVDFLEKMNAPCYKVASYEATDIPLLKRIAKTGKPVIISVGLAVLNEVELAVETLRKNGARDIAVLHCVTTYSESPEFGDMNLNTIIDIRERFGVVSGFSENNGEIDVSVTAATLGASIIEKHFIFRRSDGGPDANFSIEPAEFKQMATLIRRAEKEGAEAVLRDLVSKKDVERIMGKVHYGPANEGERYNKRFRRSLFVVKDMKKGESFTYENLRVIRPEVGLSPKHLDEVLGKEASKDIERASPLSWDLVS